VIGIQDKQIIDVANYVLTKNTGWVVAIVFTALLAAASFGTYFSRRRAGLPTGNVVVTIARVVFFGALAFAAVAVCNHSRGVPLVGLIVVFVVVMFSYLAGRTTFGRHVYAVGGNAEAARRAGINVKFIRIACFVISGACAGLGGIILASRLNSVDLTFGGGTLLLDSISAAVIGGVSALRRPDHRHDQQRHRPRRLGGLGQVRHDRCDPARGGHARHRRASPPGRGGPLARGSTARS
jgi:D-xylose transport system permease protein